MEQNDIILVYLFDVFSHPLTSLIESLGVIDHSGFEVTAVVILFIKLPNVLIG